MNGGGDAKAFPPFWLKGYFVFEIMVFKDDFFKTETRLDFVIEEEMKRAWAAELEVLYVFDDICHRNGIRYFLDFGTLLGAVRHHGFIPWDDDLDICMLRKDYMRFNSIAKETLPKPYEIINFYSEELNDQPTTTILNRHQPADDDKLTERFHGCPYIVGMDIFPLDYLPSDPESYSLLKSLYSAAYDLAQNYEKYESEGTASSYLSQLHELTAVPFDFSKDIKRQVWNLSERIAMMFDEEECDKVGWLSDIVCRGEHAARNKEWYKDSIRVPFENIYADIPRDYENVLRARFGPYYFECRNEGGAHDYPFYKVQKEFLRSRGKL